MVATAWAELVDTLLSILLQIQEILRPVDGFALLAALLAPVLVFVARNEVRLRRLRQIQDFYDIFSNEPMGSVIQGADTSAGRQKSGLATNPSFEFVRSKYTADLAVPADTDYDEWPEKRKLKALIRAARSRRTVFGYHLLFSSSGFILLSYLGFHVLISTFCCGLRMTISCPLPGISLEHQNAPIIIVGSLAFAGAYVAAVRSLLARLAVFDLSSNTFLRITAESLASVLFAMILFAAFPNPVSAVGSMLTGSASSAGSRIPEDVPTIWIALAPLLGLLPQSSTKFLIVKLQSLVRWVKTTDDRFASVTPIISLDVIDGIDYETRFRLEDCGIYDVQNLATYNPILLHIETPFGIYQCIDWVAQAQLCHIVGLERFLTLRELNVRTIFDLERAIDSVDSPPEFDDIYASILMSPTSNLRKMSDLSKVQFMIVEDQETRLVSVDEFTKWARQRISSRSELLSKASEHLIAWITDDLHVRRLRRLWNDIAESLGPSSEYFKDGKRNPANRTSSPDPSGATVPR